MAQLGMTMNAHEVAPAGVYENLPPDDYLVQIINSKMKDTAKGGAYLEIEMDVLDGPYKGRKLFDRLNIVNTSDKTVEIALRTLSAIGHAVGVFSISDSEQLHLKPMVIKVIVAPPRKDQVTGKQYDAKNEVKGYRSTNGDYPKAGGQTAAPVAGASLVHAAAVTPAPAATAAAPAAGGGTPPWRRGK